MARLVGDDGKIKPVLREETPEKGGKRSKRAISSTEPTGRRPRSKLFPKVQKRWSELPVKHRTHEVLRAMADVARIAKHITDDRLRSLELAAGVE